MAGSSLLTLIDDIAAVLDDVAVMTKVAAKKTAGVLGDDLALNAEQVTGVRADRELPVVWAVFKGSTLNKVILVPAALAISAVAPWLVTPLLMLGGGFLCYEGFEKVYHKLFHKNDDTASEETEDAELQAAAKDPEAYEKAKIKGAIRTDFVLSAEIIVIALGTVATEPFVTQLGVLVAISAMMNIGVYGLVAGIVKLDDLGLALSQKDGALRRLGEWILTAAPVFMKGLSIVGTAAMFLVGGGILAHGIPGVESFITSLSASAGAVDWLVSTLLNGVVGIIGGGVLVGSSGPVKSLINKRTAGTT